LYEQIFESRQRIFAAAGIAMGFTDFADFVERSSALIGSSQQVIEKALRYHSELGDEVFYLRSDDDGPTPAEHRSSLELFQAEVAPVLRARIPSQPLAEPIRLDVVSTVPSSLIERKVRTTV
jgi:hypothetical protein